MNFRKEIGQKRNGMPYRAVIVEDSLMPRQILKQILLSVKFDVVNEFTNGMLALQAFKNNSVKTDYLFVDIEMPVMNGIQFVGEIRPLLPECKIIMVTSVSTKKEVEDLIKLGINGYIKKPFDRNIVIAKISRIQGTEE
jgi:YesN/AraC family two-component response regulator